MYFSYGSTWLNVPGTFQTLVAMRNLRSIVIWAGWGSFSEKKWARSLVLEDCITCTKCLAGPQKHTIAFNKLLGWCSPFWESVCSEMHCASKKSVTLDGAADSPACWPPFSPDKHPVGLKSEGNWDVCMEMRVGAPVPTRVWTQFLASHCPKW